MRFAIGLLFVLTVQALADDPPQKFKQVPVPMLAAMKVINKDSGTLTDKKGDSGFWVAKEEGDLVWLFDGKEKDRPKVDFKRGEVLVVVIVKLKNNADVTVTSCMWNDSGSACGIRYKLGPEKAGVVLGGKKADYVTQSLGIVTRRPREAPIIISSESKK